MHHLPATPQPSIRDLAVIGDQRTCALVDKRGTIAWYCPWRFDQPSLFSLLIDEGGGAWSVQANGLGFVQRHYDQNTAALCSTFSVKGGSFTITDFMPANESHTGICRLFSAAPVNIVNHLFFTPDYSRKKAKLTADKDSTTAIENKFLLYVKASHPISVQGDRLVMEIPAGERGWCVCLNEKEEWESIGEERLQQWLANTIQYWRTLLANIHYEGIYQKQFYQSYKAIQLLIHAHSGAILAAATTSLPEVKGGSRNYDYRYVWLRDTAMNVSALIRGGSRGKEAERFLHFLSIGRHTNKKNLFVPFYDLDAKVAPFETLIPGTGYRHSVPLRIGNNANEQWQLDGQGNVLLAAKQVYENGKGRPHWHTIRATADMIVKNWQKKDHGIWEEKRQEHYTSSKVLAAISLQFLSDYADDDEQRRKWLHTSEAIRTFVAKNCMTSEGAYAVYAGSEDVDITAALYPVWEYDKPGSFAMKQTLALLEARYQEGELYHRHLAESDERKEGVFLAASLWMAQLYIMLGQLEKAKKIIDAVLCFSTDLGFLSEEGDITTNDMLGNIPQTFVHASLMGAILDYDNALRSKQP